MDQVRNEELMKFLEWYREQGYVFCKWWEGEFSGPMQSSSGYYDTEERPEDIIKRYEDSLKDDKE